LSRFARLAAISEAFDYHTFLEDLSTSGVFALINDQLNHPTQPKLASRFQQLPRFSRACDYDTVSGGSSSCF
ncbi:MAG: hypothetical protein JSR41_01415, partial [Proteobacteria bacterium]|nr:hypothetical protein [Pseudomonadota bacterium]